MKDSFLIMLFYFSGNNVMSFNILSSGIVLICFTFTGKSTFWFSCLFPVYSVKIILCRGSKYGNKMTFEHRLLIKFINSFQYCIKLQVYNNYILLLTSKSIPYYGFEFIFTREPFTKRYKTVHSNKFHLYINFKFHY